MFFIVLQDVWLENQSPWFFRWLLCIAAERWSRRRWRVTALFAAADLSISLSFLVRAHLFIVRTIMSRRDKVVVRKNCVIIRIVV